MCDHSLVMARISDEKFNLRVRQKSHLLTDILRNGDLTF